MPRAVMSSRSSVYDHVSKDPKCKLPKSVSVTLHGQRIDLPVYRIPLEMTFYNIKNGRFAAEYAELVKKMGREMDPLNGDDSARIQKLLVDLEPRQHGILQDDIKKNGQKDPGIITHDGFVINGNRRRSVLEALVSAGQSKFRYIEVGILPTNVTAKDLWMIEAGIQMARNVQLDYGPINELLKFKEGIDAGLSPIEIAEAIYGGFKEEEIKQKLQQYELIVKYLTFIQEPRNFQKAKRIHEHFIDLRKILDNFKKNGAAPDQMVIATHIAFQLIHDGVSARDFRKLKDMLKQDRVCAELWEARKYSRSEPSHVKRRKKMDAEECGGHTESRTIFNNCMDSLAAINDVENPEKLLGRALKNLKAINMDHASLSNPKMIGLVDQAMDILNSFKSNQRS